MTDKATGRVKVIEVDATKLDPNSNYIIVFNEYEFTLEEAQEVARQLNSLNIEAVYAMAKNPETALKVYQIPKVERPNLLPKKGKQL